MKWLWMTIVLLFSTTAHTSPKECGNVEKLQMTLNAHGMNIANEQSTRTATGGAYKRLVVNCRRHCKLEARDDFMHFYEPDHPDADENGYVAYPNIDPGKEIVKFMATINELEILAKSGKCGLSFEGATKGFMIKYKKGIIKEDHFILPDNTLITGWKRTLSNGSDSHLSFANL